MVNMCMNLGASKVRWKCRGAQAFALRLPSLSAVPIAAVGQGFTGQGVAFGPQSGGRHSSSLPEFPASLFPGTWERYLSPPPTHPPREVLASGLWADVLCAVLRLGFPRCWETLQLCSSLAP